MSSKKPVISIQSDWYKLIGLPRQQIWISAKYFPHKGLHEQIKTAICDDSKRIQVFVPANYHVVSLNKFGFVVIHKESNLKVVFIAPKAHKIHNKAVLSVSAAKTSLVVSSCEEHKLIVWDSTTKQQLLDLRGHGGPVYKCRFFPSNVVVLSAGADGTCKIFCATSGINPVTLTGHKSAVTDVCIIDKGRNVISVSKDGLAKLWDVGQSHCLADVLEAPGQINCCALAETTDVLAVGNDREIGTGNKVLVVGCEDGFVICAHVAKRAIVFSTQLESACNACVITGQTVIVGCEDGRVTLLNLCDGHLYTEMHDSESPVLSLAVLPNKLFIVGRQDGSCTVSSLQEHLYCVRVELTGPKCDGIRDISFNDKWVYTACRDSCIRKYDFNQIHLHFK